MIFEYNFANTPLAQICWKCGNLNPKIKTLYTAKGYEKYHYTCDKCGEFWVKNHCESNQHTLFKHLFNYHTEIDSHWYVKCPKCGDS